jgi:hypothetical protein
MKMYSTTGHLAKFLRIRRGIRVRRGIRSGIRIYPA